MTEDEIEHKIFSPLPKNQHSESYIVLFCFTRKVKPSPDGKKINLLTLDDLFAPLRRSC